MIDSDQLARLERLATRLYSENRMHGDEMRDAAQMIDAIVRTCREIPIP